MIMSWQKHNESFDISVMLNILLLALGAVLDIFSALVIMVSLLLPVAVIMGYILSAGFIFLANLRLAALHHLLE